MPYRTAPEKEKVRAEITLSADEYQEAITEYIIKYKMVPEGIDVSDLSVSKYSSGTSEVRPKITYTKEVVKLYPQR